MKINIPNGWSRKPIDEVISKLIDYRGKSPKKSDTGIPVISAKVVKNGRVFSTIEQTISPDYYDEWMRRGLPEIGDVVLTTEGPLGEVAQLEHTNYALGQRIVTLRGKEGVLDNRFLKFLLMSPLTQSELYARATGTTVMGISQKSLRQVPLILPPYNMQLKISELLGAIDEKYELNRKMNETLEEMARSTFKSWFVDFDPVVAKAAGQAPAHMPAETAELFPDGFGENGLPNGWAEGFLGNIATNPKRIVKPDQVHRETPYIGLEHMPRKSVALGEWEFADKVTSTKTEFKKGEFLFGKLRPYFHKVGIAPIDGICSTDIVVVAPKQPHWAAFTLACISTTEFVNYTNQASTGTKMPRTSWKIMSDYSIALPPKKVAEAFENFANPLLQKITANIHQNRTLADLRDTLLPKLMSGEIRLRDAEKAVEDA